MKSFITIYTFTSYVACHSENLKYHFDKNRCHARSPRLSSSRPDGAYQNQLSYGILSTKIISELETRRQKVELRFLAWAHVFHWMDQGHIAIKKQRKRKRRKEKAYTYTYTAKNTSRERTVATRRDFLPRTDFHRRSGRPIGNENL